MKNEQLRCKTRLLAGLWLLVCLCYGQVIWANDIEMNTSIGINGHYKYNRYIPITVTINNSGSDFLGRIQIIVGSSGIEYSETVNLAEGTSKTVTIPISNLDANYNVAKVRLLDNREHEILKKEVYLNSGIFDEDDLVMGLLADDTNRISYLSDIDLRINRSYQTKTVRMEASNIDEKVKNLDLLDMIVVNDYNTSSLLPEQIKAIKNWVSQGGTLIVGTGVNGTKTLSGLTQDFIPVTIKGSKTQRIQLLGEELTVDLANIDSTEEQKQDINNVVSEAGLYQVFTLGTGKIIVMAYDLGLEPMVNYTQNKALWKQILSNEIAAINRSDNYYYYIANQLGRILNKQLPNVKILLAILLLYILVMGVISYFVLRKREKKEYIWVVAPILSIGATLGIYGLSMSSRLAPFVMNQLDIVQVDQAKNANKISNIGILNTQGRDLVVTETDEVQFSLLGDTNRYYYDSDTEVELTQHIQYEGGETQYKMTDCSVYNTSLFVTEPQYAERPNYIYTLLNKGNNYKVEFKNNSNQKIERLFILSGRQIWDLGALEIGGEVTQDLDRTGYDMIYDMMNQYEEDKETADLSIILRLIENRYLDEYCAMPMYIAVVKEEEGTLPILQGEYVTDFHYTAIMEEMNIGINEEGETIYPYDYFKPIVESEKGQGYIDDYSPVMTIYEDLEVVLDYPVKVDCNVEWVAIGMNDIAMIEYYYNSLKGDVYLYNYVTKEYELLDIVTGNEHKLEGADLETYFKEQTIRLKVVGQNEDSGLVPSIIYSRNL